MHPRHNHTTIWTILSFCLMGLFISAWDIPVWASHRGPVFYVDQANLPQDDADGDYHFHSLAAALTQFPHPQEGDTLLLGPGIYEGDLTLSVERLTIKATSGTEQTTIKGSLSIEAKGIRLIGVSIDANERPFGVRVTADKVMLENLFVFGAQVGVIFEGASALKDITLKDSRIYHNTTGISGTQLRYISLLNNTIEANQQGGIFDDAYRLTFQNNVWTANEGDGFKLSNAYELAFSEEHYSANGGAGALFDAVSLMTIERSVFKHNAKVGVLWHHVQDSTFAHSMVTGNDADGLTLSGRSQNNHLTQNEFVGHGRLGAAGLRLSDAAFHNRVIDNHFDQNSIGLLLVGGTQSPGNNHVEGNEILNSNVEGIRVEASSGNNVFSKNTLRQNNGTGIYLTGGHDRVLENRIEQSGADGIWLDGTAGVTVQGNTASDNRGSGIHLNNGASNNRVLQNQITRNHEHGIRLDGGSDNRLTDNHIEHNRRHGVLVQDTQRLTLADNRLLENAAWGVYAQDITEFDATSNTVARNNLGGFRFQNASGVELEGNAVVDNLHVGLRSEGSQVWARRNWWGDPMGPAGVFEGRGNAVIGLSLERVLPWLPDRPERMMWSSVSGQILDAVGPGETLTLDFQDRAGLTVEVFDLGLDDEGYRRPLSLGIILLSKYAQFQDLTVPLDTVALYHVQVSGFNWGAVQLTVDLKGSSDEADPNTLKLWLQTAQGWVQLPGGLRVSSWRITGELLVSQLKPGLIALAPEGAVSLQTSPSSTSPSFVESSVQVTIPSSQGEDLSLLSLSLLLLLLGHKVSRKPDWIYTLFKRN